MRFGGLDFDDKFDFASNVLRVLVASGLLTGVLMACLMVCHHSGTKLVGVADVFLYPGVAISGIQTLHLDPFAANFVLYMVPFFVFVWTWHVGQVKRRTGTNRGTPD